MLKILTQSNVSYPVKRKNLLQVLLSVYLFLLILLTRVLLAVVSTMTFGRVKMLMVMMLLNCFLIERLIFVLQVTHLLPLFHPQNVTLQMLTQALTVNRRRVQTGKNALTVNAKTKSVLMERL